MESRMSSAQRFFLSIDDLSKARGESADLSFTGSAPESFATALTAALREPTLFQRWLGLQADPDEVDPDMGASDPNATVSAQLEDQRCRVEVVTKLSHAVLKHRLTLLVGHHWSLHDVAAA